MTITQGSLEQASKALILLHGRGGEAADIMLLANELTDNNFYIVAPQAPNNSWYPFNFLEDEKLNEPFLSESIKTVKGYIDQIAQVVPLDQVYIAGFSQGACLALETCGRFATRYGGVIALTGGLIGQTLNPHKYKGDLKQTPILISSGDRDPRVPLERIEESKKLLEKMGGRVSLKIYPDKPHNITAVEIQQAREFILKVP